MRHAWAQVRVLEGLLALSPTDSQRRAQHAPARMSSCRKTAATETPWRRCRRTERCCLPTREACTRWSVLRAAARVLITPEAASVCAAAVRPRAEEERARGPGGAGGDRAGVRPSCFVASSAPPPPVPPGYAIGGASSGLSSWGKADCQDGAPRLLPSGHPRCERNWGHRASSQRGGCDVVARRQRVPRQRPDCGALLHAAAVYWRCRSSFSMRRSFARVLACDLTPITPPPHTLRTSS